MASRMTIPTKTPWLSMREATGLSQREVERRLGWSVGRLSPLERGLTPSATQRQQLTTLYTALLLIVEEDTA